MVAGAKAAQFSLVRVVSVDGSPPPDADQAPAGVSTSEAATDIRGRTGRRVDRWRLPPDIVGFIEP
jgi:hypothetical protein